jgi:predicted nucleic acid-binding protein
MVNKFYIDTSIWMDVYEDRKGYNNEPLGEFGLKLFLFIKTKNKKLVISDLLIKELEINYSILEIKGMLKPFETIIEKILVTKKQKFEAKKIAKNRNIPPGDVLHAIISRDNKLILISRDNHFKKLKDITLCYKPEEII